MHKGLTFLPAGSTPASAARSFAVPAAGGWPPSHSVAEPRHQPAAVPAAAAAALPPLLSERLPLPAAAACNNHFNAVSPPGHIRLAGDALVAHRKTGQACQLAIAYCRAATKGASSRAAFCATLPAAGERLLRVLGLQLDQQLAPPPRLLLGVLRLRRGVLRRPTPRLQSMTRFFSIPAREPSPTSN